MEKLIINYFREFISLSHKSDVRQSGLSLVELMIVVSIIGILAATATQQYNSYTLKTRCNLSILAGDTDGDYKVGFLAISSFLNTLANNIDQDDAVKRREQEWHDFNRDKVVSFLDIGILISSLSLGENHICFQNGFKSHYNIDITKVSYYQIPRYGEED